MQADVTEIKRDVKGLYSHTEDLTHKYAVNREEFQHLYTWVQSIAEELEMIK